MSLKYIEATKSLMDGGDDVARGFPHSAYCYVLL